MTEWILITMLCTRWCVPIYADVMPTKEACESKIEHKQTFANNPSHYCVPRVKQGSDKK